MSVERIDELFSSQETLKDKWLENERLYNAKHTDKQEKKLKKLKRSKLFIPTIRNSVNIIKAIFVTAFFGNGNPIELVPLSDEESELFTNRNKVIAYYYKKSKPNKELSKAFLSALLYKMGIVITYWDSAKNKVITTNIPVTDIAFDDCCVNIDDIQEIAYKHYESNRIIKQKIDNKFYNEKKIKKDLFGESDKDYQRRCVKVIYILNISKGGYDSKTYIDGVLVRTKHFDDLPFQFGFALDKLPSIDETEREEQILCYGEDIPTLLSELQKEINQKRNQKNDIQEEIINPSLYVGDDAEVNPNDLTKGPGKRIKVKDVKQIKERPIPNEYSLNSDLSILAGDVQSAIGVNSIQEGQTNASDRRSATALAVVNSNSSMRIEEMTLLICETLFEHWAKTWVKLIFKNASDDVINRVTGEEFPFGKKGSRDEIEYDLRINFGMTLDKEKRINDLLGIYQMTSQNQNINPKIIEKLLKKILDLRIGEDTDLDELYKQTENSIDKNNENNQDDEAKRFTMGTI